MKAAAEDMKKIKSDTEATIKKMDDLREKIDEFEKRNIPAEAISQEALDEFR